MAGTSTASRAASLSGLRIVSIVASKPKGPSITDDVDDELSSRRPREALRALMLAHVALRERSDAIPRFDGRAAMVHEGEVEERWRPPPPRRAGRPEEGSGGGGCMLPYIWNETPNLKFSGIIVKPLDGV